MKWPELIENINKQVTKIELKTFSPASDISIHNAEQSLKVKFPSELVDYLKFSNGISENMKNSKTNEMIPIGYSLWPVDEMVSETLAYYKSMEKLNIKNSSRVIFFADNGCGEHFGYIINNDCMDTSVYIYYPIENEYMKVASNLEEWILGWYSGKIKT